MAQLLISECGYRIIPVGADKFPARSALPNGQWRHGGHDFLTKDATQRQIEAWAENDSVRGYAVLAQPHTGHLILDVEAAGMSIPEIADLMAEIPASCQIETPSGGRHAYFTLNSKEYPVSMRPALAHAHVGDEDAVGVKVLSLLAEVRRSNQYAVIVGPGRSDLTPDHKPLYTTMEQLDAWLDVIRGFDEAPPRRARPDRRDDRFRQPGKSPTSDLITDALINGELSPTALLPDGWSVVGMRFGDGATVIRRPGSTSKDSGNVLDGVFVIHSSSVAWADPGEPMSASRTLADSRFDGDFRVAMEWVEERARKLREDGVLEQGWPEQLLSDIYDSRRQPDNLTAAGSVALRSLWGMSERLKRLHDYSFEVGCDPSLTLASALAYCVGILPTRVRIPAFRGASPGSVNQIFFIVGNSSEGKTISRTTALAFLGIEDGDLVHTKSLETTAGAETAYLNPDPSILVNGQRPVRDDPNIVWFINEAESLLLKREHGTEHSSILTTTRTMWDGAAIESALKNAPRSLKAHSYRFAMLSTLLPAQAGNLLSSNEVSNGSMWRWIFLPSVGGDWPEIESDGPLDSWGIDEFGGHSNAERLRNPAYIAQPSEGIIEYPEWVAGWVNSSARIESKREKRPHGVYLRIKLAAAVAAFHGHCLRVTEEDFEIAEAIYRISETTREGLIKRARKDERARRVASAQMKVEDSIVAADYGEEQYVNRMLMKAHRAHDLGEEITSRWYHSNANENKRFNISRKEARGLWPEFCAHAVMKGWERWSKVNEHGSATEGVRP